VVTLAWQAEKITEKENIARSEKPVVTTANMKMKSQTIPF
jgi:hypothetical protein